MKITFISVGGIKGPFARAGQDDYLKRIKNYASTESIEVKEETYPKKGPKDEALKKEAVRILKKIDRSSFVVVLDEKGSEFGSRDFSLFLNGLLRAGADVTFVVGGPFGLHRSVVERGNALLSLSRMTLPHDMARLVLVEQVYRAFTIIKGGPYSH